MSESETRSPISALFVTAVGTEVGKTLVTTAMCYQLKARGRSVTALKPVVSGFRDDDSRSDPALILRSLGTNPTSSAIATIAPWRFTEPVSPHLAARHAGRQLSIEAIAEFVEATHRAEGGMIIVEGAGGVMSPLNEEKTNLDLIERLGYPVLLVTGSYLGAISHTLTAVVALQSRNVAIRAIVVSESAASVGLAETIESVERQGGSRSLVVGIPRLQGESYELWRQAPDIISRIELTASGQDHA
jgi:dethiobiotin synthetase